MRRLIYWICLQINFIGSVYAQEETGKSLWADSVYIELLSKPAVKDNNKILLQWKSGSFKKDVFFIIERSGNEKFFEVIGVIKGRAKQIFFEFLDEKPLQFKNFYRLKITASGNKFIYSQTVTASISSGLFCKFYPNPVDKLLIVRADSPVELQIIDLGSKIKINQQLKQGLQIVDVSMLEKGVYIIIFYKKGSNAWISEKLKKN